MIHHIACNFDRESGVSYRGSAHTTRSDKGDVQKVTKMVQKCSVQCGAGPSTRTLSWNAYDTTAIITEGQAICLDEAKTQTAAFMQCNGTSVRREWRR